MTGATRRHWLAGVLASLAGPVAAAESGVRLVCLDYGLAQTALALGVAPIGLPDPADYHNWVVEPALPPGVADVGQRTQPNLELLAASRPDVILAIPDHDAILPGLQAIAPVLRLPIYTTARQPWQQSTAAARKLGDWLHRSDAAAQLIATVDARYAAARAALAGQRQRPVLLASFLDPRHLSVYGDGSILHDGLDRLGLRNAWGGDVGRWGSAVVPLEALASHGDATLFVIEPRPPDLDAALRTSPLWQALPFVREGRVSVLPPVLMYGTLPAADRFATLLLPLLLAGAARA